MLKDSLKFTTLSIVFIGNFNPQVVQPYWLAIKGLIRENEAENAEIEVIHNNLVRFVINKWARIEITPIRFEIRTDKEPEFEAVKDLASGIFEILKETPIRAMGINFIMHYKLENETDYYEFGNKLVPLNNWSDILKDPRMFQLEILEEKRKDGRDGFWRIKVAPSDVIPIGQFGVSINTNDHYKIGKGESVQGGDIIKILKENWVKSRERSDDITEHIWKKIKS